MKLYVISASRTLDGAPVYLSESGEWISIFQKARSYEKSDALTSAISWAKEQEDTICDPFTIEVKLEDGQYLAKQGKWSLRAEGADAALLSLGYGTLEEKNHVSL